MIKRPLAVLVILLFFSLYTSALATEKKSPILLGQSCALSGPTQNLGKEMRAGLLAAFAEKNSKGGILGRDIVLISRDDGYEPYRAVRNTLEFIHELQVFSLIGEVGTPTSKAVVPIVEKNKIPFFGPFTGAQFLRDPFKRYVINVRGSYYEEMEKLAEYLVDNKKMTKIACFYQNDSYGIVGLEGIKRALQKRGLELVAKASYERNTVAVLGGLNEIHEADPDAVILVGAYPACVEFIKLSKLKSKRKRIYGSISFVGSKSLQNALGSYKDNVIISQVVPFPWDTTIPIVNEYTIALKTYQSDFSTGFGSLEGYIVGRLFIMIAERVEGELTREKFIDTIFKIGKFDLGGLVLEYKERNNQGTGKIYLTEMVPEFNKIE